MSKKKRYCFNEAVTAGLNGFKDYLHNRGNRPGTITQKMNYAGYYLMWLEREGLYLQETAYNDMLSFIDHCHLEGLSKRHINMILRSVRDFYAYLKKERDPRLFNPAAGLHIKGEIRKLPGPVIAFGKLEELYESYPTETLRDIRNKALLWMMVYQGVTTAQLHRLEPLDVDLVRGRIRIPGDGRSNGRTLVLNPAQVLVLHDYLTRVRPVINLQNSSQLFISMGGREDLKSTLHHMFRAIRKQHPDITSGKQIRAGVIAHWLKTRNLREVQYMAGHKHVSSTGRYRLNNLEHLKSTLEKYHPLK